MGKKTVTHKKAQPQAVLFIRYADIISGVY